MTAAYRLAALGLCPPWWRPFKRRAWKKAVHAACMVIAGEMVEAAIIKAWEGMQGRTFKATEKQGDVN